MFVCIFVCLCFRTKAKTKRNFLGISAQMKWHFAKIYKFKTIQTMRLETTTSTIPDVVYTHYYTLAKILTFWIDLKQVCLVNFYRAAICLGSA